MCRRLFYTLVLLTAVPPALALCQTSSPMTLRSQVLYNPIQDSPSSDSLPPALITEETPLGARSPLWATLFSAVAPGTGQIYVQRYWTIPLIWGFGYWFIRQYNFADNKYDEWRATYSLSLVQGPTSGNGDPQAKFIRDFYRDERDRFAFYLAITYVLNLVDAYVGASLYSFDVSEDLTGGNQIRMEIRIPMR